MPLQATSGAASYDGFGGGVPVAANYIEDVFSTWLYTGTGYPTSNTQSINNGIDLAGKGGLVWFKVRSQAGSNALVDTARGYDKYLYSNLTAAQGTATNALTAFNNNGFSLGADSTLGVVNENNQTYASWTFRKQPKFFDVVTWTGDGVTNRAVTHSLGSTPGCIIVKRTDTATDWYVYHRSSNSAWTGGTTAGVTTGGNATGQLKLNQTGAFNAFGGVFTYINSTAFGVNFDDNSLNVNGGTYVAYIFAHDAGGFGLTGTDNVISCGSFTTDGIGVATVSLGYEPQWLMWKASSQAGNWLVLDNMRGWTNGGNDSLLRPNTSDAESTGGQYGHPTATGFDMQNMAASTTYIYIAIRRGPMKTPTTGTSVFTPDSSSAAGNQTITAGFPTDMLWQKSKPNVGDWYAGTRLQGNAIWLNQNSTAAETNFSSIDPTALVFTNAQNSVSTNLTGSPISYAFRRAPGFFDVVCYTGNATVGRTVTHNLGVAPELLIVKNRAMADYNWKVYSSALGNTSELCLDLSNGTFTGVSTWNSTTPTSTQFTLSNTSDVNRNATNYVAYLFASCPGVSKVFSFTGNGSSQTINCGFTGGARFVMIKRTDSTGDWYVWDTARGIVANNDPHLSLNSTAAEVTTNDTIDTDSTGFVVNQVSATNVNVNGASYIGLAIA